MMTLSVRRKKAWEEVLLVRADMDASCSSHGGLTFVAPLIMTHSLVNLNHGREVSLSHSAFSFTFIMTLKINTTDKT